MFVMGDPPDYEPPAETSVAAIAAREGRTPDEVAYDYLTDEPRTVPVLPGDRLRLRDDHEPIREMLTDPATLLGLGDGGAHCRHRSSMPSVPTYMLTALGPRPAARAAPAARTTWSSARPARPPISSASTTAAGSAPGMRADINLIDFDRLRLHRPRSSTTFPPAAAGSCSGSTATTRRSSPARRSSSAASTPARCPAGSCVRGTRSAVVLRACDA